DPKVREEKVVLEHVAEAAMLRRDVDAAGAVEERRTVDGDAAALRAGDAGESVHEAGLARARAAEQPDDRRRGGERDLEPELAELLLDVDRDHAVARRMTGFLRAIHSAAISAATERIRAIALMRQACGSPPGTCV